MALALPAPGSVARAMPVRSTSKKASLPDRLVISTTLPPTTLRHDGPRHAQAPASPAESDDAPLTPMVFHPNEAYEKSRLSYYPPPPPRSVSSPSSPNDSDEPSPVLFAHPNVSSPTLVLPPLPVFPAAHSLAARLRRPLPALPKVVTDSDGGAPQTSSRHELPPVSWMGGRTSPFSFSSYIDDHDSDSATAFSSSPSSSQSSAASIYTTASSEFPDSANTGNGFPRAVTKPRHLAVTIPARSYSAPLPSKPMVAPMSDRFVSPHISVTPASPVPPKQLPFHPGGRKRTRTASATSIVIGSDSEDEPKPRAQPPARSVSPAPSLTPSISSTISISKPRSTLKRIASKTGLFGRRKMSISSDPWDQDDDDTVVGHGSLSLDSRSTRARSESPQGTCDGAQGCPDLVPRAMRRVEIAEVILTPHGDVWEARELEEVIPKLRQLRASSKIKI
ncbi:uncharacterized protein TRAVEDRAFT_30616 [Trametes versicolor FP-101664 SS1]|uniref:uncharacterized protein n=1 Tax=Trametes versicolor (strain FP-101664) TaxID=717944 RepID=UPI0004622DC1|nr:uncharacterized protein TRAVEDRAFT_30616 [Trametes versicolor FP-101664 SS1]EIW56021.1 hypothetical protein TRAVEDRAFT_30616 [Trametes versicolor FP-101664 SS1]